MHEFSLACSLVEEAEKVLKNETAGRITRLTVSIGPLSGIEKDAFEFVFPLAAEHSALEGAELIIEEPPVRVHCKACGSASNTVFPHFHCEPCGSTDIEIVSGREFLIREMEIE